VTATELTMLLANMSKYESLQKILNLSLPAREELSPSPLAMDHLLSVFLLGEGGKYNKSSTYEYLAYFFAELAKFPEGRKYFTTPKPDDENRMPLTKVLVFTEHASDVRRRGVANTIKNVCFELGVHEELLSTSQANILPFVLLPLMGSEEYDDEETDSMPEELQLLPPDKEREKDLDIMNTHLDTLLLLTSTREGRDFLRQAQVYSIVRECHLHIDDDELRDACDRLVQVIMRKEEGEEEDEIPKVAEIDEDEELIDVL
jgi:hypothetical protein